MKQIKPPYTIRGQDKYGSGAFEAPRGKRKHKGIDPICDKGDHILSIGSGRVTKIGYPYDPTDEKKGHLRYVEVTDGKKNRVRYFYVKPCVTVGQSVYKDTLLGSAQGLLKVYEGITNHFHFEVLKGVNGNITLNPPDYLED